MRMVAGPNGSGKSTLLNVLMSRFQVGHCLNPDLLERTLRDTGQVNLSQWGLEPNPSHLKRFLKDHPLANLESKGKIALSKNILRVDSAASVGYFTAMLSDYMRRQWLATRQSFTFETVMSSPDKVELLRIARDAGYRTYLYFICTSTASINVERVAVRVKQGGHSVPDDKIASRYIRTLALLKEAIQYSTRAYIFDNSRKKYRAVAEYNENKIVELAPNPPAWFIRAVLDK